MSTSQNNIVRSVAPKSVFESAKPVLSSAVTYNQGDLIYFDTSAKLIKPVAVTGNAATVIGVARQKIVSGIAPSPYQGTLTDSSEAISDVAGPVYGVVAFMTLTTGDAFNPGDKVYMVASAPQTVTSSDPGNGYSVGIFQGAAVASAAAGQTGDILIGSRLPAGATNQINF